MNPTWPDINRAYIAYLFDELNVSDDGDEIGVAWRTPHDLLQRCGQDKARFVEVPPPTGGDDGLYFEALVDFQCYAGSYEDSVALGNKVRDIVLGTHNSRIGGGVQMGRVETATGPQFVHYSAKVFRVIYSARVTVLPQIVETHI